ncbi:MAG TPA: hypothetical protein VK656_00780, partial [Candidatus Acidoferrum sp.]|nr:hypothetical protein [Candidatus Acidoferrum sp.]
MTTSQIVNPSDGGSAIPARARMRWRYRMEHHMTLTLRTPRAAPSIDTWPPLASTERRVARRRWPAIVGAAGILVALVGTLVPLTATAAAPAAVARLQLSSLTAAGGTTIVVRGTNLRPRSRVQLTWDGAFKGLPTAWVGRTGTFTVSMRIPKGSSGQHRIAASQVKTVSRKIVTSSTQLGRRVAFAHFLRSGSASATSAPILPAGAVYGSINADTKANLRIGPDGTVAHRFRASTSSALASIRFSQRGGPVYSKGSGGTLRISVRPDDGNGRPASTVLAMLNYAPGNPAGGWTTYLKRSFASPANLTKGDIYYIVFENIDGSPDSNYISVNELFIYGSVLTPRQPTFTDSSYAVLVRTSSWSVQGNYSAVMDLVYANGTHDGMGYIGAMVEMYATASGSSDMFREHFTVSGGSRTISTASVRVRRSHGSGALTIRLETGSGSLIEAVTVPASSIAASSPGGDNGGSVWAVAQFAHSHVLATGSTYNLRISTTTDTAYTTVPVLE